MEAGDYPMILCSIISYSYADIYNPQSIFSAAV